jgi:hypothetical protein
MSHVAANLSGLGLGDWFDPSCVPGTDPGCVPHWYCYVPGAVTPDCLASLGVGIKQVTADVTGAAVGAAASVGSGVVQGVGQGVCSQMFGTGNLGSMVCKNPMASALIGVGLLVGVLLLAGGRR